MKNSLSSVPGGVAGATPVEWSVQLDASRMSLPAFAQISEREAAVAVIAADAIAPASIVKKRTLFIASSILFVFWQDVKRSSGQYYMADDYNEVACRTEDYEHMPYGVRESERPYHVEDPAHGVAEATGGQPGEARRPDAAPEWL